MSRRRACDDVDDGCGAAEGTATVAGVTAVLSILGNILQAKEGADLKRQLGVLRQEKDRLDGMVRDWQTEYDRLQAEHCGLRAEHDALQKRFDALEADARRLRAERDSANEQLLKLRQENAALHDEIVAKQKQTGGAKPKPKPKEKK